MLAIVIDTSCAAVTAAVVRYDNDNDSNNDIDDNDNDNTSKYNDNTSNDNDNISNDNDNTSNDNDNDNTSNDNDNNDESAGAGRGPRVIAERVTIDARAHAELLAPSIAACLDEAGLTPAQVDAVIAGLGPGPFTGLRVGLVTAAAMADALRVPSYGVCSLDAIAAQTAHPEPLLVAGDARRREVYWATYDAGFPLNGLRRAGPDVARAADVPLSDVTAMTGAGTRLYEDVFGLPLLDLDYPTALGLARLAAARILAGAPSETLVPLYLRRPDAVAATSFKAVTQ